MIPFDPLQPPEGGWEKCLKRENEQGTVLVLVILILALISVLILAWAQEWRVELKLTSNFRAVHQSRRLAEAGVYYALGKLVAAKITAAAPSQSQVTAAPGSPWQGDQRPHVLEFPEGKVEIRVADEAGKININRASPAILRSLFTVLGIQEPQISIIIDAILDWRSRGSRPLPYGAKSEYYLDPAYVGKNGKFDAVEELSWVRGLVASPLLPRLGNWLTVFGIGMNINTAPQEVLETMGFSRAIAQTIIMTRQTMPFTDFQEITKFSGSLLFGKTVPLSFQTSPFLTITSTGWAKNQEGHYVIKVIVRLDIKCNTPWEIVSWFDGFPSYQEPDRR